MQHLNYITDHYVGKPEVSRPGHATRSAFVFSGSINEYKLQLVVHAMCMNNEALHMIYKSVITAKLLYAASAQQLPTVSAKRHIIKRGVRSVVWLDS